MKQFTFVVLISFMLISCQPERKELMVGTWEYDTKEMYDVTAKNLEKFENKVSVLGGYKQMLGQYANTNLTFEKSGKFIWRDEQNIIRTGQWGLSDNDNIIQTDADSIKVEYKIDQLTKGKLVLIDNVVNDNKQFKLSTRILKLKK